MIRTDSGGMTVWSPTAASKALDAYRAEVLDEAAEVAFAECDRLYADVAAPKWEGAKAVGRILRIKAAKAKEEQP